MKIINPGPHDFGQPIYHCWHYCKKCGQAFTHSQSSWDYAIKTHPCFKENEYYLKTVPSNVREVMCDTIK